MDQVPSSTNQRGSFGSNIGFLLSAIGSAVGLGNIWGFPYKMGKCGGFTFLLIYLALAVFVGFAIMMGELALGRKTGLGPVNAYKAISQKFKWVGWLAVAGGFFVLTFYMVLGGYCIYYVIINLIGIFRQLQLRRNDHESLAEHRHYAAVLHHLLGDQPRRRCRRH